MFLAIGAAGDVVGSLTAHRVYGRLGPAPAIVAAGVAAAAGYVILAATSRAPVAISGYALEAVGVALGNVATMSLRYRLIPTPLFGRVNNTFRMGVLTAALLGALAGGAGRHVVEPAGHIPRRRRHPTGPDRLSRPAAGP